MDIIQYLSDTLAIENNEIEKFINSAPHRYKVYKIKKRNGVDTRTIAQPSRELKFMQRLVLDKFLIELPIHKSAFAYQKGKGIKDNAAIHSKNSFLLKMDFKDFFPSIISDDLVIHVKKYISEQSEMDNFVLKKLFFWAKYRKERYRLSIGAPSSPFLSNTIMYDFDIYLNKMIHYNMN